MIMKKLYIAVAAVVIVISAGAFYALRPLTAPEVSVPVTPTPAPTVPTATATTTGTVYTVLPAESSVTYTLGETLRGKPFTVVGTTKAVTGTLVRSESGMAGEIKVDAVTLKTDAESRDRAVGRFILESEKPENQFIVFKIERVTGSAVATAVAGQLTVHGITKPVIFRGTQEIIGEGVLRIKASATVKRGSFRLVIPSIPFVADVDEDVQLDADIAFGM